MTDEERREIVKGVRAGISNLVTVLFPAREGDRSVALALTKLEEADLWLLKTEWMGALPSYTEEPSG